MVPVNSHILRILLKLSPRINYLIVALIKDYTREEFEGLTYFLEMLGSAYFRTIKVSTPQRVYCKVAFRLEEAEESPSQCKAKLALY